MPKRGYLSPLELMVLLGVLRAGRDASGIPIAREVAAASGRDVPLGSIYAALARLEESGMIRSALGRLYRSAAGARRRSFG